MLMFIGLGPGLGVGDHNSRQFLDHGRTTFYDLGIQHAASLDAVTEEAVTQALKLILDPSVYPLMIMCGGGSHRTGTVVGCLRKLQGWNLASIFEEYRRYAGAQHHIMNEQFIEFYEINRLVTGLSTPKDEERKGSPNASSQNSNLSVLQRVTPSVLTNPKA